MAKSKNQNDEKQNRIMPAIGITAMHKLLLFLSISSAAYAMDGEDIRILIPATVSMQEEEAPSFISKEWHKHCCGMCCASVCTCPSALFASYWSAKAQFDQQQCADSSECQMFVYPRPFTFMTAIFGPPILGYVIGSRIGEKTFKLDQQLRAKIDGQKQKSE